MLILTSNGLTSKKLIEKVYSLLEGRKSAVIVTTASQYYKEKDYHIPGLTEELLNLGLTVDYCDIDDDQPEKLFDYDVIEFLGGNPFYLLKSMRKSGCHTIMKKLESEKIIIGVSSGSAVMQKNINLIDKCTPEMNDETKLNDLTGMSLTNIEILPHYTRYLSKFDRFEEIAAEYEMENDCKILRIDDGQGVFVGEAGYELI